MIFCCKNSENIIVSHKTVIARSFIDRAFGLIVRKFDEKLDGMVFENCNLIHSFFMSYKFDLIFVNRNGEVVKFFTDAAQNKIFYGGRDRKLIAVELPAGTIERLKITLGDILKIEGIK